MRNFFEIFFNPEDYNMYYDSIDECLEKLAENPMFDPTRATKIETSPATLHSTKITTTTTAEREPTSPPTLAPTTPTTTKTPTTDKG